jgi:hypothetical protein
VNKLLTKPKERLSAQTAMQHAWFEQLRTAAGTANEGMSRAPTLPLGQRTKRQRVS